MLLTDPCIRIATLYIKFLTISRAQEILVAALATIDLPQFYLLQNGIFHAHCLMETYFESSNLYDRYTSDPISKR